MIWRLPYSIRRSIYAIIRRSAYRELQRRRTGDSDASSSLEPFLVHHCIFIHIPKAAGTSVKTVLFGGPVGGHLRAHEYQIAFTKEEFSSFFKFTFVRNPWSRVKSAYEFLKRGGMTVDDRELWNNHLCEYANFEDFVCKWINRSNIQKVLHFQPQYTFICEPGSKLPLVDYIGHVESIDSDLATVQRRLEMPTSAPVVENSNPRRSEDWRVDFTQQMIDTIADAYDTDIRLFGYEFE